MLAVFELRDVGALLESTKYADTRIYSFSMPYTYLRVEQGFERSEMWRCSAGLAREVAVDSNTCTVRGLIPASDCLESTLSINQLSYTMD